MLRILRLLAVLAGVAFFANSGPSFAQQGYIHEVSGSVTAQVGGGQPIAASKGETLTNNVIIATGPNSYAVLKFEDGTVVMLKQNTGFQVQNYRYSAKAPEASSAIFNMLRGGLRMITGLVTSRNREALKVATPLATIGIRGTDFALELVNPLFVQVFTGVVGSTNAAGTVLFTAGQIGSIASSTALGTAISGSQLPAGVLQFPKVPLPPATPGAIPPGGAPAGLSGVTGSAAGAAAVGAAAAAGIGAASRSDSTTTHNPK